MRNGHGLSRRSFLRAAGVFGGAAALAACAPATPQVVEQKAAVVEESQEVTQAAEKVKLLVWIQGDALSDSPYRTRQKEIFAAFEASHPDITIELEGCSERIDEKVLLAAQAGNPSDVTMMSAQMRESHVAAGTLIPLDEFMAAEDQSWVDDLASLELANATSARDGKRYCVLLSVHSRIIYYRTDLCEQTPEIWDDIVELGKPNTNPDEGRWGYVFFGFKPWSVEVEFGPFIWMQGQNTCDDMGKATFANEAVETAIQFHRDLIHKHKVASIANVTSGYGDNWAQFQAGQVAMGVNGTYAYPVGIKRDMQELWEAGKVWAAPIPVPEKGIDSKNFGNGWAWGIPKGSRYPDEAWQFIRHFSSPEMQILHSEMEGGLPIVRSAWENEKLYGDPIYKEVFLPNLEKYARPMDPYVYYMEELTALAVAIENCLLDPNLNVMTELQRAEKEFNDKYYA